MPETKTKRVTRAMVDRFLRHRNSNLRSYENGKFIGYYDVREGPAASFKSRHSTDSKPWKTWKEVLTSLEYLFK